MSKANKRLLLIMVMILSIMPLVFAFIAVFICAMVFLGLDEAVEYIFQPVVLIGVSIYLIWRIHLNYNRLKRVIVEDTDKFNDVLRKFREERIKEKFGR